MNLFKKLFSTAEGALGRISHDEATKKWLDELNEAMKREQNWRKKGEEVVCIYEDEGTTDAKLLSEYNILYANTETLAPSVYNNTPRPVVKRKVDRENPVAIAAATVLKNVLVYLSDTNDRDKAPFDELQKDAVQEGLVAGRGLARFEYTAETEGQGPTARIKNEYVCGDQVGWNRVVYGYAKNWHKIPWMAYEHFMTREECIANFGEKKGGQIKLTHMSSTKDEDEQKSGAPKDSQGVKFAHIWEIWDKRDRKIRFVSDGFPNLIDTRDDTLGLDGFFDCPRPIMFARRVSSLVPQTLYQKYEHQAQELETCTRRITALLAAMKIRGLYDGTLEGLDKLLESPENTLLPAGNVAALQQGQGLEKAIWLMPLEQLIVVLQQLYAARLQIIDVIHQITGIADIMRGATQASETLGAQQMKEAWGTLKLKRMQKEVQRFTRDCYRIQAELAAKHLSIPTLQQISGVKLPMQQEKDLAQMELSQMQAMAQMQQPGTPPQVDEQRLQQLQQTLSTPSWEEVKQFMATDSIRNYVIDIETNSTLDIEATEDKAELAEMMNSMSQLLNGVFPMVKEGVLPFPAAKTLMLSVINKFRLGDEVEETFRAMQEPQQKPDPAVQKVEAEMKRDEQKHQMELQKMEQEQQNEQERLRLDAQENQIRREKLEMEAEFNRAQHAMKMEQLQMQLAMKVTPAAPNPNAGAGGEGDSSNASA